VTLSTRTRCCPGTPVSASPAIGASDFVHGGRVPAGEVVPGFVELEVAVPA
jgi:hypothetical protein